MAPDSSQTPNVYAYHARHLLSKYHDRHSQIPNHELSEIDLQNPEPTDDLPVCVIGTGTAGLYTSMIFESLNISYHLVDADTRERVGGRIFTHHFPNGGPYDYYVCNVRLVSPSSLTFTQDVGAMRFPDTPFMRRTFDLAKNRGLKLKLIPFIMQMVSPSTNTWLLYNNARVNNQAPSLTDDPFNIAGYVNDTSLRTPEGVSQKVSAVLQPFRDLFRDSPQGKVDIAAAMDTLFLQTNNYSTRTYMFQNGMSAQDINWCETLDKSTGWYDHAFTESKQLDTLRVHLVVTCDYRSYYRELGLQLAIYTPPGPRAV